MSDTSGQQQPPTAEYASGTTASKDERLWATLCHVAAFALFLLPPVGGIIGPLIIWLLKKDEFPLVNDQGKESINFQITLAIGYIVSIPLVFAFGLGVVTGLILLIIDIVFVIKAAMCANGGGAYRYPYALRLIK